MSNYYNPAHLLALSITKLLDQWEWEGVDLNKKDEDGNTPLLIAACNMKSSVFMAFLERPSATPNLQNNHGNNIFHLMSSHNRDKNIQNFIAFDLYKNGNQELSKTLLQQKNNQGQTPLDVAASENHKETVKFIKNYLKGNISFEIQEEKKPLKF